MLFAWLMGVVFHQGDAIETLQRVDGPFDFAFIDGMHLFEFALRDFMNVERFAGPASSRLSLPSASSPWRVISASDSGARRTSSAERRRASSSTSTRTICNSARRDSGR